MEQQLSAVVREGQVAELIEHDQVASAQLLGGAPLAPVSGFGLEVVDQLDDVVTPRSSPVSDARAVSGTCRG